MAGSRCFGSSRKHILQNVKEGAAGREEERDFKGHKDSKGGIILAKKRTYTENIIEAFLEHDKISEIMRITGLSRNTLTRYRDDPQFQDILNQRRVQIIRRSVQKMQQSLSDCVNVLNRIINDETISPQIRVNAIQTMLSQCKTWTETADLAERIAALERRSDE